MVTTYITDLVARARVHLKEAAADQWSDDDIEEFITKCVDDITEYSPYETYSDTYFYGGTRTIPFSASTNNVRKILKVQHSLGDVGSRKVPREYKTYEYFGDIIEVEVDTTPSGEESESGTCTSTSSGHCVDTAQTFTSAMVYGQIDNLTDGTSTYITALDSTSDVQVQDDIFAEDDEYQVYLPYPVRIWYSTVHTYSETERTFPASYESIILDGVIAYALRGYAIYSSNKNNIGGSDTPNFMSMLAVRAWDKYQRLLKSLKPVTTKRRY